MLKTILKEIVESLYRNFYLLLNRADYDNTNIKEMIKQGVSVIPNFLTEDECSKYIQIIDDLVNDDKANIWCDNTESDQRIYFVNQINTDMSTFYNNEEIRTYLKNYLGISKPAGMLLASKVSFKEGNKGSGDGWHRDSPIRHQFKAICYLNNVTENNGCFQYIKGSHRKVNIFKAYFSKLFQFGQYRFSDKEIDAFCSSQKLNISSVKGDAGDLVLADTKGIHRGKPLNKGCRYVLFCYFWDKSVPNHFDSLKQN